MRAAAPSCPLLHFVFFNPNMPNVTNILDTKQREGFGWVWTTIAFRTSGILATCGSGTRLMNSSAIFFFFFLALDNKQAGKKDIRTCFYCQQSEGRDADDVLLECDDFDCSRSVHMQCMNPPLSQVHDSNDDNDKTRLYFESAS